MGFYLTTACATLVVIVLTALIWRKTHCVAFVVGSAFMYYWSLWGSWAVISSGGEVDTYLYHKMFPVALDADYFFSLVLYTVFIVIVQLTVLWRAKPVKAKVLPQPIHMSHYRIIVASAICGGFAYLLVRDTISLAAAVTGSGYKAIREAPGFTLYQIFLNFGMLPLSLGMAVFLCGKQAKYLVGKSTVLGALGYAAVLGAQLLFCMLVGNRAEVMLCFVAMGLFYLANAKQPRMVLAAILAIVASVALVAVKMFRDHALSDLSGGPMTLISDFVSNFAKSAEVLAAHFSMYGVLHKHIPITGGTSFVSLICSVIPRGVWPDRPDAIYTYYAQSVGAMEGQGYTIHHGTGWYLNFGVPGLMLGAFLLGSLWVGLYNRFETVQSRRGLTRLYLTIGFWTLSGGLPAILRDGPEIYKQIVIDYSIVPVLMLAFASTTLILRSNRPSLAIARGVHAARSHILLQR